MSFVSIKSKFHVALDGQGLILQGAPDHLAYQMQQAPIYGNRFAQGDRSYGDFSFWWFWAQTDWSGGLKEDPNWADDAKFNSSRNIDAFSVGGQLKLLDKPTVQTTDISTNSDAVLKVLYGTVDDGTNSINRFFLGNKATTIDGSNGCRLWQSADSGDTWTLINHFLDSAAIDDLFLSTQTLFIILDDGLYVFNDATTPFITVTSRIGAFNVSGLSVTKFLCGCDVNGTAYVVGESGLSSGQNTLKTTTDDGATFSTDRILFPIGVSVLDCISFDGEFYYIRTQGTTSALHKYNLGTTTNTLIYEFKGYNTLSSKLFGNNRSMVVVGDTLFIQFSDRSIWSVTTGDVVTREFENRNTLLSLTGGGFINHKGLGFGANSVIKRIGTTTTIYNNRRNIGDDDHLIPAATDGTTVLYVNIRGNAADNNVYRTDATVFYASGWFITNEYAEVSAIDKLWNNITINFATLVSGQSIEAEYSTNGGSTYTSLGTVSFAVEGAVINKSFLFGDAIVSKTLVLRFTLNGGGTNTPTLKDYSARFVPVVTTKKLWNLNINCGDDVKRLDGALVETVGRELKGRLERAWWTKSVLDFQDLDYATTALSGAMTAAATTITVDDTADFPEQGRIRIANEEITYTGKTPTTFTGCVRGQRETQAATGSDNDVVNNAYKVILTDLNSRVPITLEDKEIEYIVGISLREV